MLWTKAFDKVLEKQTAEVKVLTAEIENHTLLEINDTPFFRTKPPPVPFNPSPVPSSLRIPSPDLRPEDSEDDGPRDSETIPGFRFNSHTKKLQFRYKHKRAPAETKHENSTTLGNSSLVQSKQGIKDNVNVHYEDSRKEDHFAVENQPRESLPVGPPVLQGDFADSSLYVPSAQKSMPNLSDAEHTENVQGRAIESKGGAFLRSPSASSAEGQSTSGRLSTVPRKMPAMDAHISKIVQDVDTHCSHVTEQVSIAIRDLNEDVHSMISRHEMLQQKLMESRLEESEAKNLLLLEKDQNSRLKASSKAIASVMNENMALKGDIERLKEALEKKEEMMTSHREALEKLEYKVFIYEEANKDAERKKNFDERVTGLANRALKRRLFLYFKHQVALSKEQKRELFRLEHNASKRLLSKTYKAYYRLWQQRRMVLKLVHRKMALFKKHTFFSWRAWSHLRYQKGLEREEVYNQVRNQRKSRTFVAWRSITRMVLSSKTAVAHTFRQIWIRKMVFATLSRHVHRRREVRRLQAIGRDYLLSRWFNMWCTRHLQWMRERKNLFRAQEFHMYWCRRRSMRSFQNNVVRHERKQIVTLMAREHRSTYMCRRSLANWKIWMQHRMRKQESTLFYHRKICLKTVLTWRRWLEFQKLSMKQKQKMQTMQTILMAAIDHGLMLSCFYKWANSTKERINLILKSKVKASEFLAERGKKRRSQVRSDMTLSSRNEEVLSPTRYDLIRPASTAQTHLHPPARGMAMHAQGDVPDEPWGVDQQRQGLMRNLTDEEGIAGKPMLDVKEILVSTDYPPHMNELLDLHKEINDLQRKIGL